MCMLHLAMVPEYLLQYLHFTLWSWWLVSRVTKSMVTCASVLTCSSVTVGCSSSMWSWSISSFNSYRWHTLHFLCWESKCLSKSQGNMNHLLHMLNCLNSVLWYLVTWLRLYMLLLKKRWHASHSLSYSSVQTFEPFTSSTSTWGSLLPAGTLGSFDPGSSCGVGSSGAWSPWSCSSLVGSTCWVAPMFSGCSGSSTWSPWSPASTEAPRELILC